ncbi:MAG: hypothetical protein DRH90_19535 [Deltaproteobacteria bacterium]|nr:MAG: hypothetical protein DRH90_19535 [Deltaproteobacteria bacterium]RLC17937.1 MAG: hypothetical protein DRI24_04495 [Deltaproteobacteria bacterium]
MVGQLEVGGKKSDSLSSDQQQRVAIARCLVGLCDRAISRGAFGAKVTGGGRGGYMSAIVPDKETQGKVAASFIADGYQTIKAEIGR